MGEFLKILIYSFGDKEKRKKYMVPSYAIATSLLIVSKDGFTSIVKGLKLIPIVGVLFNMGVFELCFYIIAICSVISGMIASEKIKTAESAIKSIEVPQDVNKRDYKTIHSNIATTLNMIEEYFEFYYYCLLLALVSFSMFKNVYIINFFLLQTVAITFVGVVCVFTAFGNRKRVLSVTKRIQDLNKKLTDIGDKVEVETEE